MNEKETYAYGLWLEGDRSARGWFFEYHPDLKEKWKGLNTADRHSSVDAYYSGISSKVGVDTWMGIYGSGSTGVCSYADIYANVAGLQFYQKLSAAYKKGQDAYPFSFSVKDYKLRGFNEQNVPNAFGRGLKVNDNK
jgi:hypothetical protein